MPIPPALRAAYLATRYRVLVRPGAPIDVRVGATNARLGALLERHGAVAWAFVTAWNPRSQARSAAANAAAMQALRARVAAHRWVAYDGEGVGDDGAWPPEPSLLLLGIARDAAIALARDFAQNAIVAGRRGEAAALVDCTDD